MNYKKLSAFLISFFAVFFGNVIYTLSCGPDPDPYDYYISFFSPLTKGGGYEPFYYTSMSQFYADPTPSEETANVADWQNYTGSKVTEKDIRECIYTYTAEQLSAIATGNNSLPDSVKQNSFAQFLLKDKNQEAAQYLSFAKTCEPAVINADPWSVPERNNILLGNLYKTGEELLNKAKDKDIRDRYAFQLIRLKHYRKDYHDAITAFDHFFEGKELSSLVYFKALALKAGALLRLKDSVQSAYIFSRVFEKAPSLRISCFTSLMWCNTTRKQVYPLCKDNHEKAMVAAVYGFANSEPDVDALRQVYALDPASPALNILLAREINKMESDYLSPTLEEAQPGYVSYRSSSAEEKKALITRTNALQTVVDSLVSKGQLKDMDLWRVSSAYISYIRRDYPAAQAKLAEVKTKDPAVKDQWEIVRLLVNINQQKVIDNAFESSLLASLKWLDSKTPQNPKTNEWWTGTDKSYIFRKTYRNLLFAVLAPRYHQQGDQVKEVLVRGRCDSLYMNGWGVSGQTAIGQVTDDMKSADLLKLNDFLHQPTKTPYETYLAGFFPKSLNMNKVIGESYMRVHDFANARDWFKKVPAAVQAVSYQVFREQLQDFGEDTARAGFNKPITQQQFCERMVQLEEKMKTAPVPSNVYYEYASGLFSISYYGKTWYFVKDYRPSTLWYESKCDKDPFEKQYFGCYNAESYYLKAAQASTDREYRARCAFMAARCSQKHTAENTDHDKYVTALIRNRYFPLLKDNFGQTKFYQQVYNQCSYLRDYVKVTRKK